MPAKRLRTIVDENGGVTRMRWAFAGLGTLAIVVVWFLAILLVPSWSGQAEPIAAIAVQPDHPQQNRALATLRQMGPHAGPAAAALVDAAPRMSNESRARCLATLSYLGPEGQAALGKLVSSDQEVLALSAVSALKNRGPDAAPDLVVGLDSRIEAVRTESRAAILSMGREAMPILISRVNQENVRAYYDLFESIDPDYWHLRESSNPVWKRVCQVKELRADLKKEFESGIGPRQKRDSNWRPRNERERKEWEEEQKNPQQKPVIDKLAEIGPLATPALPDLMAMLEKYPHVANTLAAILWPSRQCLPELLQLIQSKDFDISIMAAKVLGDMGPAAREAVPKLIALLGLIASNSKVYSDAIQKIGPPGPESVPELLQLLSHSVPTARETASEMLNKGNPKWRESDAAKEAVRRFDRDARGSNGAGARWALGQFGPMASSSVPMLITFASDQYAGPDAVRSLDQIDPNWVLRPEAQHLAEKLAIEISGPGAPRTDNLPLARRIAAASTDAAKTAQFLLSAQNYATQIVGLEILESYGEQARQYVPVIAPMLANQHVAPVAMRVLGKVDPNWINTDAAGITVARMAHDYVAGSYHTSANSTEAWANWARDLILRLAPTNRHVVPAVLRAMHGASSGLQQRRERGSQLLAELKSMPVSAIPELCLMLAHEDSEVRNASLASLQKADANWRQSQSIIASIKEITKSLDDARAEPDIERLVAALGVIGSQANSATPILIKHLRSSPSAVSKALSQIDPKWYESPAAIEILEQAIKNLRAATAITLLKNPQNIIAVLRIIAAFGPAASHVLPTVQALVGHQLTAISAAAATAIGSMGPTGKKAAPLLIQRLTNLRTNMQAGGFADEQLALITALNQLGSTTQNTVTVLSIYLYHRHPPIQAAAIETLGNCGPAAKGSLPALKSIAKSGKAPVSTAAEEAIKLIEAKP